MKTSIQQAWPKGSLKPQSLEGSGLTTSSKVTTRSRGLRLEVTQTNLQLGRRGIEY